MNHPIITSQLALAAAAAFVLAGCRTAEPTAHGLNTLPPGFTALFNGTDLAGWWGATTEDPRKYLALPAEEFQRKHDASLDDIRKHWSVQNGELVNDGEGLYLTTEKNYGDFELVTDYKTVPRADSGIYLRGCPQVQIWDSTEQDKFALGADKGSGGLWNNSPGAPGKDPLVKADKPFGEWNHFRVVMAGARVWVWLNGKQTVKGATLENYYNRKLPVPPRGPIQLQTHGGEIRWRNLFIREIGSDEADKLLRGTDPKGFQSVFNGKDFDRLGRAAGLLRGEGRSHRVAVEQGRDDLYAGGIHQFHRAGGIQTAARRQQRPGHPLSRPWRHRVRGHVRKPGAG